MDNHTLEQFIARNNFPKFRLQQIQKAVFHDAVEAFSCITTISKDIREKLEQEIRLLSFSTEKISVADNRESVKALLRLEDGNLVETVLISPKPGVWSVCVSCQVGCQMGCRFCATGKMGFIRNLTVEEITDQVLFWKQYLKHDFKCTALPAAKPIFSGKLDDISNIVYMGMGEPFNNWETVSRSIRIFTDEKLFNFGSRSLSVSTSGIVSGIEKLAKEFPQVNLAISLHFASDEKRSRFMPVNQKYDLEALRLAVRNYFSVAKRKIFLEYIMLDGVNDTALDAKLLARYIESIGHKHLLHVNLIRYNTTSLDLKPSSKKRTHFFKEELKKYHINATIRKSLGDEIRGACGQLAGK